MQDPLIHTWIANITANAVIKFMLYIITKDLGISGKKVDSVPNIAYAIVYPGITRHFQVYQYDPEKRKDTKLAMGFCDPIFFNDIVLELCRGESFSSISYISTSLPTLTPD